jgi:hypothetical protein
VLIRRRRAEDEGFASYDAGEPFSLDESEATAGDAAAVAEGPFLGDADLDLPAPIGAEAAGVDASAARPEEPVAAAGSPADSATGVATPPSATPRETSFMDQETQGPSAAGLPPVPSDFGPPAGDAEARVIQDLEQRIARLEARLEEVADGKNRLERQVVAQTEELRVQRAAIARTQRVLRSLSRPEDEPGEAP